jgi:glucose/arabinose dehydrogenase
LITGGLEMPVGLAHAGDGSGRLFVVEKAGRIRVLENRSLLPTSLLDIADRVGSEQSEQGLLGLAFHPGFAENGLFYVNYTDRQGDTVVSRFSMASGWEPESPPVADPGSEAPLLKLDQPASNHNGGHLAFGPDGYLYIGMGDGGGAGDRYGNGQNGATLLGAMLRIDVDSGEPYAIPEDNPFVGDPAVRDEIWALGLRNPWRYSFDRLTGDLYIADVGQYVYEEVDFQPAAHAGGWNYGWPIMEGNHCFPADQECDRTGLTLPLLEYEHPLGCSVTGGYVYRGDEFPALQGVYIFGDFCTGRIWGVDAHAGESQVVELAQVDAQVSSFGEDERGEIYLLDLGRGELSKLLVTKR